MNFPKLILRWSCLSAKKSNVSVRSLCVDRIARLLNCLVNIFARSQVFNRRAVEKDHSGVQDVEGFTRIRLTIVTTFGISARWLDGMQRKCLSMSSKVSTLIDLNMV